MRHRYVVTYDVSNPKRLRRVFKIMRGFGDAIQLSVFRCDLSRTEKIMLIEKLKDSIHHDCPEQQSGAALDQHSGATAA